jgi:hypothetical protein
MLPIPSSGVALRAAQDEGMGARPRMFAAPVAREGLVLNLTRTATGVALTLTDADGKTTTFAFLVPV